MKISTSRGQKSERFGKIARAGRLCGANILHSIVKPFNRFQQAALHQCCLPFEDALDKYGV
jgi:hypothetical protein